MLHERNILKFSSGWSDQITRSRISVMRNFNWMPCSAGLRKCVFIDFMIARRVPEIEVFSNDASLVKVNATLVLH